MAKYEFVKETNWHGEAIFYTKKDGYYQSDTLSSNEEKARNIFNEFVAKNGIKPVVEVLETVEVAK